MTKIYYIASFLVLSLLFLAWPGLGQAALIYQRLSPLGTIINNPITVHIDEGSGFAVCSNPPFDFWGIAFTTSSTGTAGIGFIQTANDSTYTSDTYTINLPAGNYFEIYFLCNPVMPLIGQPVDVAGWPHVASDHFTVSAPIEVQTKITPSTLNLKKSGGAVKARLKFPTGHLAKDVVCSSVKLNNQVPATSCKAHSSNLIDVFFDVNAVKNILTPGNNVLLTVSGKVGISDFIGSDTIRVK